MSAKKDGLSAAKEVFTRNINLLCKKFGLNNIMAQLYVLLYFSGKPLSLNDMVSELGISKASASVNIRALERYGAVKRVWVKDSRKDYYEAESDISKVIKDRVSSMANSRLSEINNIINSASAVLAASGSEDPESLAIFNERLEKLKNICNKAQQLLDIVNSSFLNGMFSDDKAKV